MCNGSRTLWVLVGASRIHVVEYPYFYNLFEQSWATIELLLLQWANATNPLPAIDFYYCYKAFSLAFFMAGSCSMCLSNFELHNLIE